MLYIFFDLSSDRSEFVRPISKEQSRIRPPQRYSLCSNQHRPSELLLITTNSVRTETRKREATLFCIAPRRNRHKRNPVEDKEIIEQHLLKQTTTTSGSQRRQSTSQNGGMEEIFNANFSFVMDGRMHSFIGALAVALTAAASI